MTELQYWVCIRIRSGHSVLHVPAYNTNIVHNLYDTDHETRLNYLNWYFQPVIAGEVGRSHTHSRSFKSRVFISE